MNIFTVKCITSAYFLIDMAIIFIGFYLGLVILVYFNERLFEKRTGRKVPRASGKQYRRFYEYIPSSYT